MSWFLVRHDFRVFLLFGVYAKALVVVVALGTVLAYPLDEQDASLDGAFAADGEPDFSVDQRLIEIKPGALLDAGDDARSKVEVVDEADLKMGNLAVGFIHPHGALQGL